VLFGYASPWFAGIPINALCYFNMTPDEATFRPTSFRHGKALAEAGRELAFGFALKPPAMSAYCEDPGFNTIAEGFRVSTVKEMLAEMPGNK
jgi:hypothetical protein